MKILEHRSKKGLLVRLGVLVVVVVTIVIVVLCNKDTSNGDAPNNGVTTVTPTVIPEIAPTKSPTPKPTVVYQRPTGTAGSVDINVTLVPTKTPTPEPTRAPNDFDSSDYVTYNPDGTIVFDFDSYTEDALGKKSE